MAGLTKREKWLVFGLWEEARQWQNVQNVKKFNICIYQCAAFVYKHYIHFIFLSLCSIVRIYILPTQLMFPK